MDMQLDKHAERIARKLDDEQASVIARAIENARDVVKQADNARVILEQSARNYASARANYDALRVREKRARVLLRSIELTCVRDDMRDAERDHARNETTKEHHRNWSIRVDADS